MKNLFLAIALLFFQNSFCQSSESNKKEILNIVENGKQNLEGIQQLLIVINDNDTSNRAILVALEKRHKKWKIIFDLMIASIGRNGFALPGKKREGDGKSPTGLYQLGQLFSYENKVNTSLPFIQTTLEDKWIDDTNHVDYNKYVKGKTTATSFEHLRLSGIYYKYCMVIEYNTNPVFKGKGSAIFFHVADANYTPTAGCVAIKETDMEKILFWLKPNLYKAILMGNKNNLKGK
jgi:L,D-peptidoglycan transpeptidase YkuD (ErfK/YbiS/YcfS/YnhG family)